MNRLLEKISNKNTPQKVPIRTEEYSTTDGCFFNVLDKISFDNGEIVYGWKLYQTKILEEAERHAVWNSPMGELIDITPDKENQENILFLEEDKGWKYDGTYSDNIRVNKTDDPLVDDLILLSETITKLRQTGIRKSRMEIEILEPVYRLINLFEKDKYQRELFIAKGYNIESSCYCGSNAKYKECHGFGLRKIYNEIIVKVNELIKTSC